MDILLFQMDFFKSTMVFFSSEMNYNPDDTTHILRSVQRPCGHGAYATLRGAFILHRRPGLHDENELFVTRVSHG